MPKLELLVRTPVHPRPDSPRLLLVMEPRWEDAAQPLCDWLLRLGERRG